MNDADELEELFRELEDYPDFIGCHITGPNFVGGFESTPLHLVAVQGRVDKILLLLKHGAEVNFPGEHGYTPLHEAAVQGHEAAVELLLAHGARRDLRTDKENGEWTAFELAEALGGTESMKTLLRPSEQS